MHTQTGQLTPTAPYDFGKSLKFLEGFMPMQDEQTVAEHELTKAISLGGQTIAFQLRDMGTVEAPQLKYTLFSEQPMTDATKDTVIDRITFFLSLADDLRPFYLVGLDDPCLGSIIQELYGYHQVKFMTPFETACWAILSQRNPMTHARKVKQALAEKFGGSIHINGTMYQAFPEPAQLFMADTSELLSIIHNERRTEYISTIAKAFDGVDEQFLRTAPQGEVEGWLRKVKGIGEWSANFILLRGLGRMEQLPVTESRVFEAASKLYGQGKTLSKEDLQRIADKYGHYQGYWAHYLRVAS